MRRPSDEISPKSAKTRRKRPLARPSGVEQKTQEGTKSGLKVDLSQNDIENIFASIALGESENPALALNLVYEKALDAIAETVKGAFTSFAIGLSQQNLADIPFLEHALSGVDPEKVATFAGSFLEKIDQSRDRIKLSLAAISQDSVVQGGGRESILRAVALSQGDDNPALPVFGERLSTSRLEEILADIQKTKTDKSSGYVVDTRPGNAFKISFNDASDSGSSRRFTSKSADHDAVAHVDTQAAVAPESEDIADQDGMGHQNETLHQAAKSHLTDLEGENPKLEKPQPTKAVLLDKAEQREVVDGVPAAVQQELKAETKSLPLPEASHLAMDLLTTASQSLGESLPLEWLEIFASLGQGEELEGFGNEFKDLAEGVAESMSALALEFARVALEAEADIQKERAALLQAAAQETQLHALKEDVRVANDEEMLAFLDFLDGRDDASEEEAQEDRQADATAEVDDDAKLSNEDLAQAFALLLEQFET